MFSRLHNRSKALDEELSAKQVGPGLFHGLSNRMLAERDATEEMFWVLLGDCQGQAAFLMWKSSLYQGEDRTLSPVLLPSASLQTVFSHPNTHLPFTNHPPIQKDKEDLEELSTELELADEDSLIPYAPPFLLFPPHHHRSRPLTLPPLTHSYKIGDSFMHLPLPEAQDLLTNQTSELESDLSSLEEELEGIQEQISGLKAHLYARFGRGINLEA